MKQEQHAAKEDNIAFLIFLKLESGCDYLIHYCTSTWRVHLRHRQMTLSFSGQWIVRTRLTRNELEDL